MKINSRHCNVKQHDTTKNKQLFELHFKRQNQLNNKKLKVNMKINKQQTNDRTNRH